MDHALVLEPTRDYDVFVWRQKRYYLSFEGYISACCLLNPYNFHKHKGSASSWASPQYPQRTSIIPMAPSLAHLSSCQYEITRYCPGCCNETLHKWCQRWTVTAWGLSPHTGKGMVEWAQPWQWERVTQVCSHGSREHKLEPQVAVTVTGPHPPLPGRSYLFKTLQPSWPHHIWEKEPSAHRPMGNPSDPISKKHCDAIHNGQVPWDCTVI